MNRQKLIILPKLNNCNGAIDKQWFVYYSCRDPRSGKMVRFRHYDGFTGLNREARHEHAKQVIEALSVKLRSGWSPLTDSSQSVYTDQLEYKSVADIYGSRRSGNNTVRMWISRFLEELNSGIRHETQLTYKSKFRIFNLWIEKQQLGNNDLRTIDNKLISLFFHYLIDCRQLSGKSVKYYRMLLAKFFNYLYAKKVILINPVYDIPPCKRINDQAPRPIQRADLDLIKAALERDTKKQILLLALKFEFYCGMRPGKEVRLLKIKEIDFSSGTVYVNADNAKNSHARVVTIPLQFLEELRRSGLQKLNREYYIFGSGNIPGPVPIGKNKLSRYFKKVREDLGLPSEYKLYSGKHTGMIEADNTGKIPANDISKHVDHADLSTTSIYFKNKKAQVSEAIRNEYPDF